MFVTEEEAKDKMCARMLTNAEGEVNCCVGSECMSWRWERTKQVMQDPENPEHKGFCGIAGKPE